MPCVKANLSSSVFAVETSAMGDLLDSLLLYMYSLISHIVCSFLTPVRFFFGDTATSVIDLQNCLKKSVVDYPHIHPVYHNVVRTIQITIVVYLSCWYGGNNIDCQHGA